MRKTIRVGQLRPGMYVQRVHGPWLQHPYWRASFTASERDVERLLGSDVEALDIDTSRGADVDAAPVRGIDPAVDAAPDVATGGVEPASAGPRAPTPAPDLATELSRARRICQAGREAVEAMFREVRLGRTIDPEAAMPLAREIAASVDRHPGALIGIARLKTADDYTYLHSVAVSALMGSLARQMGLPDEECQQAALGGLLHDMGKARMPQDILNKPSSLTDAEFAVMRTHPEEGERLLRDSGVENGAVLHMVRHHHERFDGAGYPLRLPGGEIPLLTRMSTVCDVYDAVTSNRPYKEGWDPGEALRRMATWKGQFDPAVLKAFIATVGIYPIGTLVRLSSDRLAVVIEQNPALSTPKVRVFHSARTRSHLLVHDLDLAATDCADHITGLESPRQWGFRDLDKLWAP